jgi:hypothetical protein
MRINKKLTISFYLAASGFVVCTVAVMRMAGFFTPSTALAADAPAYIGVYSEVANVAPSVVSGSIHLNDGVTDDPASITLSEGGSSVLRCKFEMNDADGCEDIDNVDFGNNVTVYYSEVWAPGCYFDERNCYYGAGMVTCSYDSGSCTGGADTTASYTCETTGYYAPTEEGIRYYAQPSIDAGNWNCAVLPKDEAGATGTLTYGTTPTEVNELLAFKVAGGSGTYPASDYVSYGTINLGAVSIQQSVVMSNTGNMVIDTDIKSYDDGDAENIACTSGKIAVGMQNYSMTDSFTWNSSTADSSTVFRVQSTNKTLDANLAYSTYLDDSVGNISHDEVYWKLKMPSSLVGGTCSDSLVFTAKESV